MCETALTLYYIELSTEDESGGVMSVSPHLPANIGHSIGCHYSSTTFCLTISPLSDYTIAMLHYAMPGWLVMLRRLDHVLTNAWLEHIGLTGRALMKVFKEQPRRHLSRWLKLALIRSPPISLSFGGCLGSVTSCSSCHFVLRKPRSIRA